MSVSLLEVLQSSGFDIRNNPEDAQWLLSRKEELEELMEVAEETSDDYSEYQDYVAEAEEAMEEPKSFEDWRNR
jgi:hypothetical protein